MQSRASPNGFNRPQAASPSPYRHQQELQRQHSKQSSANVRQISASILRRQHSKNIASISQRQPHRASYDQMMRTRRYSTLFSISPRRQWQFTRQQNENQQISASILPRQCRQYIQREPRSHKGHNKTSIRASISRRQRRQPRSHTPRKHK